MTLQVFGSHRTLVQSTSPLPGKLAVSVVEADGAAWPDMFLWDPMSQLVHYNEETLVDFLLAAKRREGVTTAAVLGLTDGAIAAVKRIRGLFGGSYGGALGFGPLGTIVAMASAVLAIMAAVAAVAVVVPLSIVAVLLRYRIGGQIRAEKQRVLDQVTSYFEQLQRSQDAVPSALPAAAANR
jgi:hypothetical protein